MPKTDIWTFSITYRQFSWIWIMQVQQYLPFCLLTGSQRITNLSEDLKHKDIQSITDLEITFLRKIETHLWQVVSRELSWQNMQKQQLWKWTDPWKWTDQHRVCYMQLSSSNSKKKKNAMIHCTCMLQPQKKRLK